MTGRILQLVALLLLALSCSTARAQAIVEFSGGNACHGCVLAKPTVAKLNLEGVKIVEQVFDLENPPRHILNLGIQRTPTWVAVDKDGHEVARAVDFIPRGTKGQVDTETTLRKLWAQANRSKPTSTQ